MTHTPTDTPPEGAALDLERLSTAAARFRNAWLDDNHPWRLLTNDNTAVFESCRPYPYGAHGDAEPADLAAAHLLLTSADALVRAARQCAEPQGSRAGGAPDAELREQIIEELDCARDQEASRAGDRADLEEALVKALKHGGAMPHQHVRPFLARLNRLGYAVCEIAPHDAGSPTDKPGAATWDYQPRVGSWMDDVFAAGGADLRTRIDRHMEEVFEQAQALGYDPARIAPIRDYVFSRPVGEPAQETGGVMVTLASLCHAAGIDMVAEAERELARVHTPEVRAKIMAKQASKNALHTPLPVPPEAATSRGAVEGGAAQPEYVSA